MENKKYKLDLEDFKIVGSVKLFRIVALTSFSSVSAGDLGGYIKSEENLSISGDAWVYGNASVSENAEVFWISKIGSDLSTLTVFRTKDGFKLSRGCFLGTFQEFKKAVEKKDKDCEYRKEYELLYPLIEHKFGKFLK